MKVLYAGDDKIGTSQFFVGADNFQVFTGRIKDYEPVLDTLDGIGNIEVEHLKATDAVEEFPWSLEELEAYDVLVVSDFSRDTLLPHFSEGAIPGPNRIRLIKDFVEAGGGLVYCGGWMTYQGYRGVGNWQGTYVDEVLPVEIKPVFDDRKERPEGAEWTVLDEDHPITAGMDTTDLPVVYGYNETAGFLDGADALAEVEGHPFLAAHEHGNGRVIALTTDPGPKWGNDLLEWGGYEAFWERSLRWVAPS